MSVIANPYATVGDILAVVRFGVGGIAPGMMGTPTGSALTPGIIVTDHEGTNK
jgi:hypothetical protein